VFGLQYNPFTLISYLHDCDPYLYVVELVLSVYHDLC